MAIDWNQEAEYIQNAVEGDTPAEFHYNDAVLLRYCRMQQREAEKAGQLRAAQIIHRALMLGWPNVTHPPVALDKAVAYKFGHYMMPVPPVTTAIWSDQNWIDFIDANGKWTVPVV